MRPNDMPRPFAPDHSDGDDLVHRLRRNVLSYQEAAELADEIKRLRAEVACEEQRVCDLMDALHASERELAALREKFEKAQCGRVDMLAAADAVVIDELPDAFAFSRGHRVRLVRED